MDNELLVETRIDDGQRLIDQLVRDGFPVGAVMWLKATEESPWLLYIASPAVDLDKPGDSYGKVYASLSKVPNCSISLAEIKLINGTDPISRNAVALRDRRSRGKEPIRFKATRLGDLLVEEMYIYPRAEEWFRGFAEIKRQFPSAEVFSFYVLYQDVGMDSGMQKVRPLLGRINANEFEGRAPGTVYFVGPQASSAQILASLVFVYRPEGWNTLFRSETQRWEEVRFVGTNQPPYESADFAPLAAMKTDRKPHQEKIEQMKQMLAEGYCITLPPDRTVIDTIPFTPTTKSETLPSGVLDWEAIRRHIEEGGRVTLQKPASVKA
jgi:hypothetical protein